MTTKSEVAILIAQVIQDYNKVSITTTGSELKISDRLGASSIPINTARMISSTNSTFR